jgi:Reverse transcriptase (RNA-dependent DNA polymerase)
MSELDELKGAQSRSDIAALLGFSNSGLSYILYKMPSDKKYLKFQIPKNNGGIREICASRGPLKVLQRRLSKLLYACRDQSAGQDADRSPSHGFRRAHSNITNARQHRRRRYVLNLDLENFFGCINFGRVRGFFLKDNNFLLAEPVATVIAQIACYENSLPQGSPCSPIISDMVSQVLDSRLSRLAKSHRVRYTRYAGDLSGSLKRQAEEGLDQWFEGMPFPLASISRAWLSAPSQDFKTKHEHLLHFFEATAEFVSVILISAFSSNEALFALHKQKIAEEMERQHLSFKKATFGTWKLVVEYLGKQTRQLLSADKDTKALCGEIFSDPTFDLPQALSRKEFVAILQTTNKMRNDWTGHGGVVGQAEAKLRNEELIGEVQKLREAFAETWTRTKLIQAGHCMPRRGIFETEVSVLMGSNSEFLKEVRAMGTYLDVERLYLYNGESGQALKLLPLIQVGPSPQSAKNACYFFNRIEKDGGARFIHTISWIDRN